MEILTDEPRSGRPFEIEVSCDVSIVGEFTCPPTYYVHLRGPIAYTSPPGYENYRHDALTGRTVITVTLKHPGIYQLWAYPEWPLPKLCPVDGSGWGPDTPPVPAVSGSGHLTVTVVQDITPPPHFSEPCTANDYRTPMESAWFSLAHIREEYKRTDWLQSHIQKSSTSLRYQQNYSDS